MHFLRTISSYSNKITVRKFESQTSPKMLFSMEFATCYWLKLAHQVFSDSGDRVIPEFPGNVLVKTQDPGGGWFTRVQVEMDASFSLGFIKGIMRARVRLTALTLRNGNGKRESGRGAGGFTSSTLPRFVVY